MNEILSQITSAGAAANTFSAYIDPATTSYIIQIIVGAVIALGTVFGIFRSKIKRALKKNKSEDASPDLSMKKNDNEAVDSVSADDLLSDDEDGE